MQQTKHKWPYFVLWVLCILGSLSVLPYTKALGALPAEISFRSIVWLTMLNTGIAFGLLCLISYFIVPKTDLHPFKIDSPLKRIIYPGLIAGVATGLVIYVLDVTVFKGAGIDVESVPLWTRLLASFYGGINEEVQLRLFLFTLLYVLIRRVFRISSTRPLWALWTVNIIVAIFFGVGHLPVLFKMVDPSVFQIIRVLVLNFIPGLVFGWLYWTRGLVSAMAAHFVTDMMIHVALF